MLKHILVPLDGSPLAEAALDHALNIVEPGGRMTLVSAVEVPETHVYGYYPPATVPDFHEAEDNLLPFAKNYLEGKVEELSKHGITAVADAEIGEPAEVITQAVERYHVDAIVMSTHGRSGLGRWLFGSVTQKVLSARPCPVYVIPSKEQSNGKH